MGCCKSTCVLHGCELVTGPDFKPFLVSGSEEPLKLSVESASCKNMVAGTQSAGTSGGGGDTQQARSLHGTEALHTSNSRSLTAAVSPQPAGPSEVIQFRRLQYRELTPEDYELLCLLDESLPNKNTAPPSAVTSLPRILASDCDTTECNVCLTRLEPYTFTTSLPCGHAFHPECISKWLTQCKGTCPLCNSVLDSKSMQNEDKIVSDCSHETGKKDSILMWDTSVESEVDAIAARKLTRASITRCGMFATNGDIDGSFIQPRGGDDSPAE